MSRKTSRIAVFTFLFIIMVTAITHTAAVTWSVNITRMTTALTFDGDPSIIQANDGKIWIVWAKAVMGDNTLFCKTSYDLGVTWSVEKNLTYIPPVILTAHDESPSIIQAANGTIWLVYHSNKPPPLPDFIIDASPKDLTIPQGGSDNSGISIYSLLGFSEAVTLSAKLIPTNGDTTHGINATFNPNPVTPPANGIATSSMTVTANATANPGSYTLIVIGKSEDITHSVSISLEITGSGMAGSGTVSFSDTSSSSVSASSAGYEADFEIYYKTSNDNGASWSNRSQLTNNTNDDLAPSIVQLTNGTIMIVYGLEQGSPVTGSDIFYNATSDGTSWTYGNITTYLGHDQGPSIMQAKDEKIWVAWASDRSGDYEIFCKTYNGSSWSNATQLTNSANSDSAPSLLQTMDGTIWLFWHSCPDKLTAPGDIYYKFSADNGATWSDRIQFTTDGNEDLWPTVTQTRDTKIWVVWTSDRADQPDGNWDIYSRASLAGDVNEDGVVDIFDLTAVAKAYASVVGGPEYDPDLDITKDGRVDMRDIAIISKYYGST
jgi:hypothetical protein